MKKKRTYSRKQRGLRWLVRLVALVVVLNVTGIYHIHPDQTIPARLQKHGLAPTQVIHREWTAHEPVEDWLLTVSENRDAIVLTASSFRLLSGWYDCSGPHEIMREDPDSHDRSWIISDGDREREIIILFGFVPAGEEAPTFKIGMYDYRAPFGEGEYEDLSDYVLVGEAYFDGEPYTVKPVPTIPVQGGMCYLKQVSFAHKTLDPDQWDCIVLCDRTGKWEKCSHWTSTHLG